jgi:hypothetical protein
LVGQSAWASLYLQQRPRPRLLLPSRHLLILHRIFTDLKLLVNAEDKAPADIIQHILDQPKSVDTFLSVINSNQSGCSIFSGLIQDLAWTSDSSLRLVLEKIASYLITEQVRPIANTLFLLKDLSSLPKSKGFFKDIATP